MADYALPTITNSLGTYSIQVTSTVAALTVPTVNTIVSLGSVKESLDLLPGQIDISTMQISFVEDYTVHTSGFWGEALAGTCTIRIYLNEGSGDTFVFWGKVNPAETRFEEQYVSGSTVRRIGTITLVSSMTELANVSIADLITELDNHWQEDVDKHGRWYKHIDIIRSAVTVAFSQAYSTDAAYLVDAGGTTSPITMGLHTGTLSNCGGRIG